MHHYTNLIDPAWLAAHPAQEQLPARLRTMHRLHGTAADLTLSCGKCPHLVRQRYRARVYFKCPHYGITRGAGTDWRQKWPACSLATQNVGANPGGRPGEKTP